MPDTPSRPPGEIWLLAGFYYACGRNDAGNPFVPPEEFGLAFAKHRTAKLSHHHSVQDFYTDYRMKVAR